MSEDINITNFAKAYISKFKKNLNNFNFAALTEGTKLIWDAYSSGRTIFFIGNGGSAATASHMANDFAKGTIGYKGDAPWPRFKAIALTESVATFTAWANDVSFEDIFSEQLKNLGQKGDVLVAISASGNSPNILKAVKTAKGLGLKILGLSGFDGGKLSKIADVSLAIKDSDYGRVEDAHLMVQHLMTEYLYEFLLKKYSK